MPEIRKRETAHKLRIGDILSGTPIVEDIPQDMPNPAETASQITKERFRFLELGEKRIIRVNVIANVIDKYTSEAEKKYSTVTIDDATGQIRVKAFGDDASKIDELSQGDTVLIIGLLRSYNQEIYISPDIIKKCDPKYLLVRKLELQKHLPKVHSSQANMGSENQPELKDLIIDLIRTSSDASGVSAEEIILKIKTASPEAINSEVIKLIEDGTIYEPRPGKVRWLG
jgi:hypothetical protein